MMWTHVTTKHANERVLQSVPQAPKRLRNAIPILAFKLQPESFHPAP